MKLSFEQKIEIYNKWKLDGHSFHSLAHEYKVNCADIQYLLRLADRHVVETLRHKWTYDSPDIERIRRKIEGLGFGKRSPRKRDLFQAVTELRQELKRPLYFILQTVQRRDSLPYISRSVYYSYRTHPDPDAK